LTESFVIEREGAISFDSKLVCTNFDKVGSSIWSLERVLPSDGK